MLNSSHTLSLKTWLCASNSTIAGLNLYSTFSIELEIGPFSEIGSMFISNAEELVLVLKVN